ALRAVNQKRGPWQPPDSRVLDALEELGSIFDEGVDRLEWIAPSHGGRKSETAEFVPAALPRIRRRKQEALPLEEPPKRATSGAARSARPKHQEPLLEGLLEPEGGSVRITPPHGAPLVISYSARDAATVLSAIHKSVRVIVDKEGKRLVRIEVTEKGLLDTSFFARKTLEQLRLEQGVP